ncbi:MAG TPA: Asp-tRNA(Asn)/Glu-tRNA(Gln) amidotransferase GatCAB subunit C [Acidimicrobiaceae bacterium]|jgi:aspartyl-tRNA(Asn)/glutamyl-tRNA(Gln) amidotransferase subunit C|nr:Asp-tRNA(Asn)/Glu-tRNA(Gln) amidotransferase GatCAB subunit C [Acidimicrobiaceae bacterium]HCV37106.1 Asp-tRNA(Asn)/Glu-tRNA(Gln) amidotransferase GatCAB subunit C [Acidimicrobiaceae bacterium]|tara:strand:+ start:8679 stop:9011 length:333 start_codon:yes stop_codon:yes gene_type:complete
MPTPGRITRDDVAYVARLARLNLTDAELEGFTGQLADVLDHVADIEALALDGVVPTSHPLPLSNVFRADEPAVGSDDDADHRLFCEEVLAAAPAFEESRFRVPPVLGEAP